MTAITDAAESVEPHRRTVHVTVRTPAGAAGEFDYQGDELVISAVNTAVEYFVTRAQPTSRPPARSAPSIERQLAPGDYGMTVVRHGESTDMTDTSKLDDYGIVDGDELHLINEKPQVDG
jgi:hypothetical protein